MFSSNPKKLRCQQSSVQPAPEGILRPRPTLRGHSILTLHFLIGLAVLLLALPICAQTTASISGVVHDTVDALVPGARITLINEASKATRSTTSNGEGFFNFLAVQPATYSIEITKATFETWKVTGVEVHPGDSLAVPKIKLQIGNVAATVTVTAEVAGVSLDSPEHSTLITAADISRLATTGRDALELVSTLPGFTLNAGTGGVNSGPDYTTTTFGSGNLANFGANGAAPQQGLVNVTTDGAQVIDPGDMGGTTATINMDQVQEVKVQTSNFGADEAKGPIVINAIGKSGGSAYHGSLYSYARNKIFNSNDWLSNDLGSVNAAGQYVPIAKTPARYFYPGGTLGGPVKIPGTHFNENKHLTFWVGYEQYVQTTNANGTFGGPTTGFIPTPAMLSGDLSNASLGQAFNVPASDLATNCAIDYAIPGAYSDIGANCHSPGGVDQNGAAINAGKLATVNPADAAYTKYYPAINRTPQPTITGQVSDGINWVENIPVTNNGYQLHSRVDENISDSLKLYGVYNWEKVNSENPLNNVFYNPPDTVPYPTPLYSHGDSNYATLNLTKIVSSSITNELIASGMFFNEPEQFGNRSLASATGTPWETAGYEGGPLKNGDTQLPWIYSYEWNGIPNFSMGNVPAGGRGEYYRKSSWNLSDNLTKVYHTHTLKAGVYAEQTRNNQDGSNDANSEIYYARYDNCLINQTTPSESHNGQTGVSAYVTPGGTGLGNTVGNFLIGCPYGYSQSSSDPGTDMYFNSLEFYATDEWKVNSKLTLTLGIRLSHLPPWSDSHGIGAAVWDPSKYTPIQQGVFDVNMTNDTSTWPGISWHKLDPSIPVSGVGSRALFYSPRVGLAYDLYGNGKTVFRGGWGAYRSRDSFNLTSAAVGTSLDVVDHGVTGNSECTLDQIMNGYTPPATAVYPPASGPSGKVVACGFYGGSNQGFQTGTTAISNGTTVSVNAVDAKDNEQPLTYNYNFTLDQKVPFGAAFEIAYVGNQSTNLATSTNNENATASLQNMNAIPLGAFFGADPLTGQLNPVSAIAGNTTLQSHYRPYPNYAGVYVPHHTNWANYNALQVSLTKQSGSLVFGVNYTWSKAMGVRGNYDTGYTGDPINPHHDYGIVSFDRPQAINFTYSYQEGKKFHGNRELGWVLNDWEASGITSLQSGPNLSMLNGSTNFGFTAGAGYVVGTAPNLTFVNIPVNASEWLGSSDYSLQPTVTCDPRRGLRSQGQSRQYANGNCYAVPALGTQGWWNLPDVHGPAYEKSDLSIYKDVKIDERQSLQLRASGFNFLNHPISSFNGIPSLGFADPTCNASTGAGCFTSEAAALSGMTLQTAGFGYTPYKWGVRILEFGMKYNF